MRRQRTALHEEHLGSDFADLLGDVGGEPLGIGGGPGHEEVRTRTLLDRRIDEGPRLLTQAPDLRGVDDPHDFHLAGTGPKPLAHRGAAGEELGGERLVHEGRSPNSVRIGRHQVPAGHHPKPGRRDEPGINRGPVHIEGAPAGRRLDPGHRDLSALIP